jgi:hypothetical protein
MTCWLILSTVGMPLMCPRAAVSVPDADLQSAIAVVRAVGPDGKGSPEAAKAWIQLAQSDLGQLPNLLAGMDGASPLARNWLRSAIDEVLERAQKNKEAISIAALESFVRDTGHNAQARRLAYELILQVDKFAADRFLPSMADDPSLDLRRDAVARVLDQAEKFKATGKKDEARHLFQKALASSREKDQISKAAKELRDLGQPVDLASHLGLLTHWRLIGPFPHTKPKEPEIAYPPERRIDLGAEYDGKSGKVRWQDYVTKQEYGIVDLNAALGAPTEGVAYATSEFTSAGKNNVEIRIGCYTPFKLWVNGELLLVRGDAYTGMSLDHYVTRVHFNPGRNIILLKITKDEPQPGAGKDWRFQLRVCDEQGSGIRSQGSG